MDYKAVRFEERYRQSKFDVVVDTIGGAPLPVSRVQPRQASGFWAPSQSISGKAGAQRRSTHDVQPGPAEQTCQRAVSCRLPFAGDYNWRSQAVLKPNGYIAHILNQGWVSKHGAVLGNVYEVSAIAKGCDPYQALLSVRL